MEYIIFNDLLRFWEDFNRSLELQTYINNIQQKVDITLPGSQISKEFFQLKALPRYKDLRQVLEKNDPKIILDINENLFLPNLPKGREAEFENEPMKLVMEKMHSFHLCPIALLNWAITKKICSIQNRQLIEAVAPSEKNYLDNLPYSIFMLDIGEGLQLDYKMGKMQITKTVFFRHFLIQRNDNDFYIFGIPENISHYCYQEEDCKLVNDAIDGLKKIPDINVIKRTVKGNKALKKAAKKIAHQFNELMMLVETKNKKFTLEDLTTPIFLTFMNGIEIDSGNFSYRGLSIVNDSSKSICNGAFLLNQLLGIVNGFCKLLSEHQIPEISPEVEGQQVHNLVPEVDSQSVIIEIPTEKLKWYEVPINNIDFMKLHKTRGKLKVSITTGGEKSPHQRRAHRRIYRDENGIEIKRIWVKSLIVRKDKLITGTQSKSGILKV